MITDNPDTNSELPQSRPVSRKDTTTLQKQLHTYHQFICASQRAWPPGITEAPDCTCGLSEVCQEIAREAVYGFHEYIMGKDLIQPETDQAFNYARLHRAIDSYIAQLTHKSPEAA